MKEFLEEILVAREVPSHIKEKIIAKAKTQILLNDLGNLFGKNVPSSATDLIATITAKSNNHE